MAQHKIWRHDGVRRFAHTAPHCAITALFSCPMPVPLQKDSAFNDFTRIFIISRLSLGRRHGDILPRVYGDGKVLLGHGSVSVVASSLCSALQGIFQDSLCSVLYRCAHTPTPCYLPPPAFCGSGGCSTPGLPTAC